MIKKVTLEFQLYEVEIIQRALAVLSEKHKGPWVKKPDGQHWYSDTIKNKRIGFVQRSIRRQLPDPKEAAIKGWYDSWP